MMQRIHDGPDAGPSSVVFLPMIDLIRPMKFDHVFTQIQIHTFTVTVTMLNAMITYDKPLWWKVVTIIENEPESSDLRQIVGWLS